VHRLLPLLLLTTLFAGPRPVLAQPETMLIAVLELDVNDVGAGEARAIAERLRVKLSEQAVFEVVERNRMQSILEEQGFQFSGACDTDECVVQVGRILGVRKVVAGSVSKVGTLYSLQVRIVDVESARIEHVAYRDVNGIEEVLTRATNEVADELAREVAEETVGLQPAEPAPERRRREEAGPGAGEPAGPAAGADWRSETRHTGWIIRLSPGPAGLSGTSDSETNPITFSGAGFGWDILCGKTVLGNLMLFFNVGTDRAADPEADNEVLNGMIGEEDELATSYVGAGMGLYFPPRQWWIAAAMVFTSFEFTGRNTLGYYSSSSSNAETGFYLGIGRDWWLARGVGLGVMLRLVRSEHVGVSGLNMSLTFDLNRKR